MGAFWEPWIDSSVDSFEMVRGGAPYKHLPL
jgi:hypothetical protein